MEHMRNRKEKSKKNNNWITFRKYKEAKKKIHIQKMTKHERRKRKT